MQQGLLSDVMQDPTMSQPEGAMGGMSDVDMAVEDAMMSGGMEDVGFGVEMASEEEHQMLEVIMDDIEGIIHGEASSQVTGILENFPEPYEGIAHAAHTISVAAYMKANKDGLNPSPDIFLAENGVIQETVELVFEVAEAMGKVTIEDDELLSAAYMNTMKLVGETLLEGDNPEVIASAQELIAELELDTPIDESVYGAEALSEEEMMMQDQMGGMAQQQPMPEGQMGGMPPMSPTQGMI